MKFIISISTPTSKGEWVDFASARFRRDAIAIASMFYGKLKTPGAKVKVALEHGISAPEWLKTVTTGAEV